MLPIKAGAHFGLGRGCEDGLVQLLEADQPDLSVHLNCMSVSVYLSICTVHLLSIYVRDQAEAKKMVLLEFRACGFGVNIGAGAIIIGIGL